MENLGSGRFAVRIAVSPIQRVGSLTAVRNAAVFLIIKTQSHMIQSSPLDPVAGRSNDTGGVSPCLQI